MYYAAIHCVQTELCAHIIAIGEEPSSYQVRMSLRKKAEYEKHLNS